MPQPWKRLHGEEMMIGPNAVASRKKLATKIALVASCWVDVENALAGIYAMMLFGADATAFTIYHRIISPDVKRAIFTATAEEKLSPDLLGEARQLLKKIRERSAERNRVVHGYWAATESKPDSLLLCEPKDLGENMHRVNKSFRETGSVKTADLDIAPDNYMEYKDIDFDNICTRIMPLVDEATALFDKVLNHGIATHPAQKKPPTKTLPLTS